MYVWAAIIGLEHTAAT